MKKAEFLKHWIALPDNQAVQPTAVPYKHQGATFDEDGIRITGTRKFIDSVLSRLKDLLRFENGETRLQVLYQETKDKKTGKPTGSYSCYIQVHERGDEAKVANALASALAKHPVIRRAAETAAACGCRVGTPTRQGLPCGGSRP